MTINDTSLLTFKAIASFIHDMNEIYGSNYKPLLLYSALVEKTGIIHEEPIRKHLTVFQQFLVDNEEAIMTRNEKIMKDSTIRYSEKVFINMAEIFEMAGNDKASIWQHLLTLSALLNPASKAKEILRKDKETKEPEDDFLSHLVDKVGKHIDPSSTNPMESMNNLVASGVFGELMSSMDKGIGDGTLDMQKMVGSLQNMIGSLSTMMDVDKMKGPGGNP
jgi:hypothetical protein